MAKKRFKRNLFPNRKGDMIDSKIVKWLLLLVTAAVIIYGVIYLGVLKRLQAIEPKCGGVGGMIEGIEGQCACAYSDSKCPAGTESSANHPSCPLDSYSVKQCTTAKDFRKLKALAEKDSTLRGTCCLEVKAGSVLDSI